MVITYTGADSASYNNDVQAGANRDGAALNNSASVNACMWGTSGWNSNFNQGNNPATCAELTCLGHYPNSAILGGARYDQALGGFGIQVSCFIQVPTPPTNETLPLAYTDPTVYNNDVQAGGNLDGANPAAITACEWGVETANSWGPYFDQGNNPTTCAESACNGHYGFAVATASLYDQSAPSSFSVTVSCTLPVPSTQQIVNLSYSDPTTYNAEVQNGGSLKKLRQPTLMHANGAHRLLTVGGRDFDQGNNPATCAELACKGHYPNNTVLAASRFSESLPPSFSLQLMCIIK